MRMSGFWVSEDAGAGLTGIIPLICISALKATILCFFWQSPQGFLMRCTWQCDMLNAAATDVAGCVFIPWLVWKRTLYTRDQSQLMLSWPNSSLMYFHLLLQNELFWPPQCKQIFSLIHPWSFSFVCVTISTYIVLIFMPSSLPPFCFLTIAFDNLLLRSQLLLLFSNFYSLLQLNLNFFLIIRVDTW